MSTVATVSTVTAATDDNGGLWVTISEVARRRGVDKAVVSRRVAKLVADGVLTTLPGERGSKLVNLAAYDHATGATTDFGKVLGAETKKIMAGAPVSARTASYPVPSGADVLPEGSEAGENADVVRHRAAKADQAVYDAEKAKLDYVTARKLVLPIAGKHGVEEAMVAVAEKIVTAIERIPTRAADITAAVSNEGELGARKVLKDITHKLREMIAAEMRLIEQTGLAAEAAGPIETEINVPDFA